MTFVGRWSEPGVHSVELGGNRTLMGGPITTVVSTGRAEQFDLTPASPPQVRELFEEFGFSSLVGAPIIVSGQAWGAVAAAMAPPQTFPPGSAERVEEFARLVSLALANAEARSQLAAQRARIVSAGDEERRRLERNLHDGAQQRLVSLSLCCGSRRRSSARTCTPPTSCSPARASSSHSRSRSCASSPAASIEQCSPSAGWVPRSASLAARATLPVKLEEVPEGRLPSQVEAAAYYVIAEALTNVSKYAEATAAIVRVAQQNGFAVVEVADDGVGGADPTGGSGLRGLADRVEALDGRLAVESTPGQGTTVRAEIPLS